MRYFQIILLIQIAYSAVIEVPTDFQTIQAGIDACLSQDTLVVEDGHYIENPIVQSKAISIVSRNYLEGSHSDSQVTIDGNHTLPALRIFDYTEEPTLLGGIKIVHGGEDQYDGGHIMGGGVLVRHANVSIRGCEVTDNYIYGVPGVRLYSSQGSRIAHTTFYNNRTGIYQDISTLRIDNITIDSCRTGILIRDHSSLEIFNSTITRNYETVIYNNLRPCVIRADRLSIMNNECSSSNAVSLYGSTIELINCSILGNISSGYCLRFRSSIVNIHNSILWGNQSNSIEIAEFPSLPGTELSVSHSLIENGIDDVIVGDLESHYYWLSGNLTGNPLVSPFIGTLLAGSPCIDAGDPSSPLDPDGTIADMGAFYFCQGEEITLPEDVRLTTEPQYQHSFSVELQSACDPVQIDSAKTATAVFVLLSQPDSVAGEFKTGEFQLLFDPQSQGLFTDTLHIWANTEISNTEDPRHHVVPLIGEAGPIPAAVQDLSISIHDDLSAQLTWSPVDTTIYGNPVTPDWYLVFYNEQDPLDDSDWYYQGAVAGSEYTHFLAAQFADVMNYRVVAWKGIDPRILDAAMSFDKAILALKTLN